MEERFSKIRQAVKQYDEGIVYQKAVEDIKVNYKIFNYGYEELISFSKYFNDPVSARAYNMNDEDSFSELSKETLKLLNNCVLASKSFRDHTKIFVNSHFKGSEFYNEHAMKVKQVFGDSELLHFVQELRNYTFNKDLPLILVESEDDKESIVLGLDIEKLRQWSGWTDCSKAFIDTLDDRVELGWFIKQYWMEVEEFYEWFNSKIRGINPVNNYNIIN